MSLGVYRWGWFATAMSRAIWGWLGGSEATERGFTPQAVVSETVFKAAPVTEKGHSVKDGRRTRVTRSKRSAGLVHNVKTTASSAYTVSLPESGATLSQAGAKRAGRAAAGARAVKVRRQPKGAGTARVVNKTKKP